MRSKLKLARTWIAGASAAAAGVGATPIPVADAAVLVPIQAGLMAKIAAIYNVPKAQAIQLATSATGAATMGGKFLGASLAKFIPGGSVVTGAVAGSITATVGESWRKVSEKVSTDKLSLDADTMNMLSELFKAGLNRNVKHGGTPVD